MSDEKSQAIYRILDANANRVGEGLRTMEEYARFVRDDSDGTSKIKSLRHDLTVALTSLDRSALLKARNTPTDVGTEIQVPQEYSRSDTASVVRAAASRTQQSLRVLEEYGKVVNTSFAAAIEAIRYRTYTLCADLELSLMAASSIKPTCTDATRSQLLSSAQLYVLIDAGKNAGDFAAKVQTLSAAGVDVLQLRDHDQTDRVLFDRAVIGSKIAREQNTLFIVNDRADIAAAADADGVHVGQDELPATGAREVVGRGRLVGVSTHALDEVHHAIADGADYIGCGPVFESQTKSFQTFVGTKFLTQVHAAEKERPLPAFAIGGISTDNLSQVTATGFHRVAVTNAISGATDPAATVKQLVEKLQAK